MSINKRIASEDYVTEAIAQITTDKSLTQSNVSADAEVVGNKINEITEKTSELKQEVAVERARINKFTTLAEGSTTGDAELEDARVDYTGKTWDNVGEHIRGVSSELSEQIVNYAIGNLFDKTDIIEGKYITSSGWLDDLESYFTSGLIDVSNLNGKRLRTDYVHIVIFFVDEENAIQNSMVSLDNEYPCLGYVDVPNGAKYMRFSTALNLLDVAQIGTDIKRSQYKPFGYYALEKFPQKEKDYVVVAKDGSGDFTSFTRAIYETECDVIVKSGAYRIETEYIDLFGADWVANMSDATEEEKLFNFGIMITQRKVTFEAGAILLCDWSAYTIDYTHRFSPICLGANAEIYGMVLDATNVFYVIHDDYGTEEAYTNVIKDCVLTGTNIINYNIIGGGCKKSSTTIVDGCYMNNNATMESTMRYHNTNNADARPVVIVKNCYVNRDISFRWYGSQAYKMICIAHNNVAPLGVGKQAEDESRYNVDNVDLFAWGNRAN